VNQADHIGFTPLMRAIIGGHQQAVTILVHQFNADCTAVNHGGETAITFAKVKMPLMLPVLLAKHSEQIVHTQRSTSFPRRLRHAWMKDIHKEDTATL